MTKQQSSIDNLKKRMAKGKKFKLSVARRESSDKQKRLTDLIGKALLQTANEPWLLVRFEEFMSPKPASLDFSRPWVDRIGKLTDRWVVFRDSSSIRLATSCKS